MTGKRLLPPAAGWERGFFDGLYVSLLDRQSNPARTKKEARFAMLALGLQKGGRVLDAGCGYGRHAAELARLGCSVTGLDSSPAMIREGRRRYRDVAGLALTEGDMRRMPFRGAFDAVVCLFTSYGYFDEAGNARALSSMVRALRPGGKLLMDHRELGCVAADSAPSQWWNVGGRFRVQERFRLDRKTGISSNAWWVHDAQTGRSHRRTLHLRYHTLAGWKRRLAAAGARIQRVYGGFDGQAFKSPGSPRMILVATRSKAS